MFIFQIQCEQWATARPLELSGSVAAWHTGEMERAPLTTSLLLKGLAGLPFQDRHGADWRPLLLVAAFLGQDGGPYQSDHQL